MTPTQKAIKGMLAFFESGNGVPVDKVVIRADCAEVAALRAALAEPVQEQEPASSTAGMNIAQRILHVGGRNNAAGYVEFGSSQAVEALVKQVVRDLPRAQQPAPPTDVPLLDDRDILGMWHATSSRVPMCNHYNHFARAIEQAVRQKAGLK